MRLAIVATISLAFSWLLMYGALRTAERIAQRDLLKQDAVTENN